MRKNINSRLNKLTRTCTVCRVTYPKTKDYFSTFVSKRDGEVFQTKCKECERLYVQAKNSQPLVYLKDLIRGIVKDKKRLEKGFNLDYAFIVELYNKQNQKCAIIGIEMTTLKGKGLYFSNVSIDRKDPNLGYLKSNIQLVCFWANQAKGTLSMNKFKEMISITNTNLLQDGL